MVPLPFDTRKGLPILIAGTRRSSGGKWKFDKYTGSSGQVDYKMFSLSYNLETGNLEKENLVFFGLFSVVYILYFNELSPASSHYLFKILYHPFELLVSSVKVRKRRLHRGQVGLQLWKNKNKPCSTQNTVYHQRVAEEEQK